MTSLAPTFVQEAQENELQKKKQIKHQRLTKLAEVFAKANSVLTSKRISVKVVDMPQQNAPAWSSTTEVWLNSAHISDEVNAQSLLSLQGLDFHETAHLLFTPRRSHAVVKQVIAEELWEAFNCLEDSRIENLMVGYLPSIKSWLTATITDYLLKDEQALKTAYPLIVGRKYLPQELQQLCVDNYIRQDDIDELADILDEYNQIIYQGDNTNNDNALNLIRRFKELLNNLPPLTHKVPTGEGEGEVIEVIYRVKNPNGHNGRPIEGYESSSTRPKSRKEQEGYRERANKQNKDKSRPKPTKRVIVDVETPSDIPQDFNDDFNGDTFGDSFGDDDNETPNSSKESSNASKDNQDTDYPSHEAGTEAGTTGENQQVTDTLQDVMQDVIDELSKEVNQIAKQLGVDIGLDGGNAETPERAKYQDVVAPADLVLISNAFGKELERLRANYEPAWETQVDVGRLNVNRYLSGEDFDTCFDEWREGKVDVVSVEAVILLDKSGSMSGANADNAYKAMWGIARALEQVNAKTSVVLFDYDTYLLYSNDEKVGTTIRDGGASGGTDPSHALAYAKRVLAETEKPIKLLFMITDGYWNSDEGEKAVREMRNAGVLTCQALISDYEVSSEELNQVRHSFELMTKIKTAKDILTLGKDLIRLAIARNLA